MTSRLNSQHMLASLFLALIALLVVAPLLLLLFNSFQVSRPDEPVVFGLDGWRAAITSPGVVEAIYNSFNLALTRQAISLFLGIFIAWLLARTDIPMRSGLEFMFWIGFFIPSLPVALGWILVLDPQYGLLNQMLLKLPFIKEPVFNIYSFWGIVWVHLSATTLAIKVMLLAPAFRNLDAALEEAARVAGASPLRTLWGVVVPVMMPAILVSLILGIIRSLEAFEIELILGVPIGLHVYGTKIYEFVTYEPAQFPPATALGSLFLIVLLALVAMQRLYLRRKVFTTVTGKGFSLRPVRLERWRFPAFCFVLGIALVVSVIPVVFLFMGSFMRLFGYFDIEGAWTLANWREVLGDPLLTQSFRNTLILGLSTAGLGVIFSSLVAYVIVKSRFFGSALLDLLSWLPWAIPGILMGMALMWSFLLVHNYVPIYGTMYALIVAMAISGMPLAVQVIKSILMQLGDELEETSRVCGASWFYTYRRIVLPLLLPGLLVVGLLEFIAAARNISTVVLLSTGRTRPLSILMLDYVSGAEREQAAVVAAIIVLIVVVAALIARYLGGQITIRG